MPRATILHRLIALAAVLNMASTLPAAEPQWRALPAPAPQQALVDCRSPIIDHEKAIKLGDALDFANQRFVFSVKGKGVSARISPTGDDAKAATIDLPTLPALLKIAAFGGDYALSVRLDSAGETVRVASAFGIAVPIGTRTGYLVDSNLDGKISGGDGIVAPGSRTVGLIGKDAQLWSRANGLALSVNERGQWIAVALDMPRPQDTDHGGAWRNMQWQRMATGVMPVRYADDAEKGMRAHISYLQQNKLYTHWEDPDKPGYTREGALAGMTSVVGNLKSSAADGMQSQLLTLFHRSSLLAPELTGSAIVYDRQMFMCSTKLHTGGPLTGKPLVYPPHGMSDVPCEFNIAAESPMPFDGEAAFNKRGTAVCVRFAQFYYGANFPQPPTLSLHAVGKDGALTEVKGDLHHPDKRPRAMTYNAGYLGHIALIPSAFLAERTTYRASAAIPLTVLSPETKRMQWQTFRYEWEFTTGDARRK